MGRDLWKMAAEAASAEPWRPPKPPVWVQGIGGEHGLCPRVALCPRTPALCGCIRRPPSAPETSWQAAARAARRRPPSGPSWVLFAFFLLSSLPLSQRRVKGCAVPGQLVVPTATIPMESCKKAKKEKLKRRVWGESTQALHPGDAWGRGTGAGDLGCCTWTPALPRDDRAAGKPPGDVGDVSSEPALPHLSAPNYLEIRQGNAIACPSWVTTRPSPHKAGRQRSTGLLSGFIRVDLLWYHGGRCSLQCHFLAASQKCPVDEGGVFWRSVARLL